MAALVIPLALAPTMATAAIGDEIIVNGDFETLADPNVGALVGASTEFALAQIGVQGFEYADPGDPLTSWDEGTYVVAQNPFSQHILWADQPDTNHRMIVNGFEADTDQTVWSQSNPGVVCDVGDQVTYDFSAKVANILPLDRFSNGGANITVWINDVQVAAVDLTNNDPDNVVPLTGNVVPASDPVVLTIKNGSGVKIGNDFSLDDISLIQTSGCLAPVTPAFLSASPATCDVAGGFEGLVDPVFPLDRGDYTLSIDPAFTGAGTYTLTATADEGFAFPAGTVTTAQITIDPIGFELDCTPAIGGRTIGFWTNKVGTAAEKAGGLWALVKAEYPVQTAGLNTFGQAQTFMKNATSTGTGITMLRAQFFATALNVQYIAGYGAQEFVVPLTSAILPGETVTVVEYLNAIEAGWAGLDTKAEITSVQNVLNAINQDVASDLFV